MPIEVGVISLERRMPYPPPIVEVLRAAIVQVFDPLGPAVGWRNDRDRGGGEIRARYLVS